MLLLSSVIDSMIQDYINSEYYIRQLLLDSTGIVSIEKNFTEDTCESNSGIYYVKFSVKINELKNGYTSNSIFDYIVEKRESIFLNVDLGAFDRVCFDIDHLLLHCRIVNDLLLSSSEIRHFPFLYIDIDLSKYYHKFKIHYNFSANTYMKFFKCHSNQLCFDVGTDTCFIDVKKKSDFILIYNNEPSLLPVNEINIILDISSSSENIADWIDICKYLKNKNDIFNNLLIYINHEKKSSAETDINKLTSSLEGYFKVIEENYL